MSKNFTQYDLSCTQNRELSWLKFNERVLEEAEDRQVPLLERMRFVSIFSSNLDEFFMVRVGALLDLGKIDPDRRDNKSGKTPKEQLNCIHQAVLPLLARRDKIYSKLRQSLFDHDICELTHKECSQEEQEYIRQYYQTNIFPLLKPILIQFGHSQLHGSGIYVCALLRRESQYVPALIPIPESLPRIIFLPNGKCRFIRTEEVILTYMAELFPQETILEQAAVSLIRNADFSYLEKSCVGADYADHLSDLLKLRNRKNPVKLEFQGHVSFLAKMLSQRLNIPDFCIYQCACPLIPNYAYQLKQPSLEYQAFSPLYPSYLTRESSIWKQVAQQDVLLFYPYQSMQPFLDLLEQSSIEKNVISIQITLYRLAPHSQVIQSLIRAAQNGKKVTVFIELRARFDEQNNIKWAKQLKDAGCQVLYGPEEFKCHSKICLITKKERNGQSYLTQIGTGNYNEVTAKLYTDFCFMTTDSEIGADAAAFFNNMLKGTLEGTYRCLLVSPYSMKNKLLELIDAEIAKGDQGRIIIKANSITDRELIDQLVQASQAGVKVDLIIRGICCIVPGIPGKTDRITVTSIVGRFLEHSRVYAFGTGSSCRFYLSSADLMTRNQNRRVEIACPVVSRELCSWLSLYLKLFVTDNAKARMLTSSGIYQKKTPFEDPPFNVQEYFMQNPPRFSKTIPQKPGIIQKSLQFLDIKTPSPEFNQIQLR